MFPSWDINYKTTRWNEPSLDFVFLSQSDSFVLVELKNLIPNRSSFLSAFCQVSHRAVQFADSFSKERLLKAFNFCMTGACHRTCADADATKALSERLKRLPNSVTKDRIYRVLAAIDFPKEHLALLEQFNGLSHSELSDVIGIPPKSAKERLRFSTMKGADYDPLRTHPASLYTVTFEK